MSDLETKSIHLLGSLLEDIALDLDVAQQSQAALWATKMALLLDSVDVAGHKRFYEAVECEAFKNSKAIPLRTLIWMARDVWRGSLHSNDGTFSINNESVKIADGCTTTCAFGHLIFQVLTVRPLPEYSNGPIRVEPYPGRWPELLVPIWPITSAIAKWPPSLSFSDDGEFRFASLLNRWGS